MKPMGEVSATSCVQAQLLLRAWGIEQPAADVPILMVPFPVAYLVMKSNWSSLVLLTRWHRAFNLGLPWVAMSGDFGPRRAEEAPGPMCGWPPADSDAWRCMGEQCANDLELEEETARIEVHDFSAEQCSNMSAKLRQHAPTILAAVPREACDQERVELATMVRQLDKWRDALLNNSGELPNVNLTQSRFRHTSEHLVETIRLVSKLQGGPSSLRDVVKKSLALAAPGFIARPLIQALEAEQKTKRLPSPSLIRMNELAIDIALMLFTRRRPSKPVARFGHADSSPISGVDWLWHQFTEL